MEAWCTALPQVLCVPRVCANIRSTVTFQTPLQHWLRSEERQDKEKRDFKDPTRPNANGDQSLVLPSPILLKNGVE